MLFLLLSPAHAATVTWTGGATGNWKTAANWSSWSLPLANDTIIIGAGSTVTYDGGGVLPTGATVELAGTLTNAGQSAIRLSSNIIKVAATGSLTGGFWDLNQGSVRFAAGAQVATTDWEHKGTNSFHFTLNAAGFTKIQPGRLRSGNSATWANVTFVIDATNYDLANGTSIVLADFSSNDAAYNGTFNPTVQITKAPTHSAATLVFDTVTSQVILTFATPPPVWDGGGSDGLWTTAANWDPNAVPVATSNVFVPTGAVVSAAPNTFSTLDIAQGASVTFAGETISGTKTLTVAGTLNRVGVLRFGSTLDLSGALGSGITFLDTGSATMHFRNGASFANPSMSFEHRGTNTFKYTLAPSGFTTLNAGFLFSGSSATWPNVTYIIDISAYNHANGLNLVLADFTGHSAVYGGTFNPNIQIITGTSGLSAQLTFNTTTSSLVLSINPPGNDAPVAANQSFSVTSQAAVNVTLTATDLDGDPLTYSVVSSPTRGTLSGTAPLLTYTPNAGALGDDSFTFTVSDGTVVSNVGKVSLVAVPATAQELWASRQAAIVADPLQPEILSTTTANGITLSQIRYSLGTLTGSRVTASPMIAAYYAAPVGGTNLPGIVDIHGGGQKANADFAKYWAGQGYAAISINWGGLPLDAGLANTDWAGLAAGFSRTGVTDAIHHDSCDPKLFTDGATLYDVAHPMNCSWILNSYAGRRALTYLQSRPEVNGTKLGVVGWSMGGHTTVITATDPRITCVAPGVGGTGFLFEDWWGLPGTAKSTTGMQSLPMYFQTVDCKSYWPNITCPAMFVEAANDFNAPFDLVTQAMKLQNPAIEQRLVFSPHFNHRLNAQEAASQVLWMRTHLKGDYTFPKTSTAQITLATSDGIPVFKVWPDTTTALSIAAVDIYYGVDRNSLKRFWRDAQAVNMGTHWQAPCPVFDKNEMMVVLAQVHYNIGFSQPLQAGYSPAQTFSVASEVKTIYPADLAAAGVKNTAAKERVIDDFSRGYKDWFRLNADNPEVWQLWTRKVNDQSWTGPPSGGSLAFTITSTAGNSVGIKLLTDWNETPANSFIATVPITAAGVSSISLPRSSFLNQQTGVPLSSWDDVVALGIMPAQVFGAGAPVWTSGVPTIGNLRWVGGTFTFTNGVTSDWLELYGLILNDATTLADTDGEGKLNWEEFVAGTNPLNPTSLFQATGTMNSNNQLEFQWPAVAGKTYQLFYSPDLTSNSWIQLGGNLPYSGNLGQVAVSISGQQGFYRIGVQ